MQTQVQHAVINTEAVSNTTLADVKNFKTFRAHLFKILKKYFCALHSNSGKKLLP
jgi:hypothetical protein